MCYFRGRVEATTSRLGLTACRFLFEFRNPILASFTVFLIFEVSVVARPARVYFHWLSLMIRIVTTMFSIVFDICFFRLFLIVWQRLSCLGFYFFSIMIRGPTIVDRSFWNYFFRGFILKLIWGWPPRVGLTVRFDSIFLYVYQGTVLIIFCASLVW